VTAEVWLVVSHDVAWRGLLEVANGLRGSVSAVVVGPRELADQVSVAVDRLDWVATTPDVPAEAWASAVAGHLEDAGAVVVLAGNGPASRVIIGSVAARLRVPLLAPVLDVTSKAGGLEVTRMVYGGIALAPAERQSPTDDLLLRRSASPSEPRSRQRAPRDRGRSWLARCWIPG